MILAKPLGIQNPLQPSKPLGRQHQLSTVFLPEQFVQSPSKSTVEMRNQVLQENKQEDKTEKWAGNRSLNNIEKSSGNFWPTVVDSLSQIRLLNEPIMEGSTAIAPEIVFDPPGSNTSLVPVKNIGFGELSVEQQIPSSWSSLAELVENSTEDIQAEEIIFTPTGFQRQNGDLRNDQRRSPATSGPPEDTYAPSVSQPVTISSPYFASEPEELENLDAIVNEVYRRIIDRLQIERERNGRFYSGRLRW